jgi:hypothetical protein
VGGKEGMGRKGARMVVYLDLERHLLNDAYVTDEEQHTAMASRMTKHLCDCNRAGLRCMTFKAFQRYPLIPL